MRTIFIKRAGKSAMHVRVFQFRPKRVSAARGMRRKGLPCHAICTALGFRRERYDRIIGPAAFFRI
ncbi:hypothetical protein SAMN05892877_103408 [Rhizobium subbaraonis]|uniref:Uncharacterized protein n=1 Tax=Rhizobium subbaraonis TaxID=908946 RepID=A0A285U538_9HYPH|nr:hypothetical protein SAMN05892877_103408 [Rhizobium subbaraonis]